MIPVNQDIDSYKDDFFKGLTMRQTLFAVAAVVVSGGLLAFFLIYLKLNASVAMYLTLPVMILCMPLGLNLVVFPESLGIDASDNAKMCFVCNLLTIAVLPFIFALLSQIM